MQEQVILNALLHNDRYCRKVLPYIKPEYFSDGGYQEVFNLINSFVGKYNCLPTKEALLVELGNKNLGEGLYESATQIVQFAQDESNDLDWLLDSTEKWAQERAVYNGIMRSISILEGKEKKLDKHAIPTILSEALGVCFDSRIGHDYFDQAEEQWDYYHNVENKVPYNIEIMNKITKGGNTRKTLSVVMAGINVGKTTWLINMAQNYLDQGLNVIYFTLEVAEEVIRERSDVCFFGTTFDELRALDKIPYMNRVKSIRDKTRGQFIIREFPGSTVHVGHFRHVLNELKLKKGFKPDVIIVDYLSLMLSSIMPPSAKADSNTYFTSVTEELRALMKEYEAIGWTAAQFNRGGQDADDVTMSDTGLAIGIQATADFTVAFMAPEEIAKMGKALGKVLKNRFANKQTIGRFMIGLDNDRQKYMDVDASEQRAVMEDGEYEAFSKSKVPTPASPKAMDWSFGG